MLWDEMIGGRSLGVRANQSRGKEESRTFPS